MGKKFTLPIDSMVNMIIYLTGPLLVITKLSSSEINLIELTAIIAAAALIIIIQGSIFLLLSKGKKDKSLTLPAVFGNTGFLGYPVSLFAYGTVGLASAIMYDIISGIFIFSIGVYLIHEKKDFKEIAKIPLFYAIIVGILLNQFSISIPKSLFIGMDMIGSITIPFALLVLGYQLAKITFDFSIRAFGIVIYKMLGGFLLALAVTSLLKIEGIFRAIIIIEASMPSAMMSMVLVHKYTNDSALTSSIVSIGMLVSLVSIPLLLLFLA